MSNISIVRFYPAQYHGLELVEHGYFSYLCDLCLVILDAHISIPTHSVPMNTERLCCAALTVFQRFQLLYLCVHIDSFHFQHHLCFTAISISQWYTLWRKLVHLLARTGTVLQAKNGTLYFTAYSYSIFQNFFCAGIQFFIVLNSYRKKSLNNNPELFMHIRNCICKWLCIIRQLQS